MSQPIATPATAQRQIAVNNLTLDLRVGVLEQERLQPQPVRFDVEVDLGQQPILPQLDELSQVLDYRLIHAAIVQLAEQEHRDLLETVLGKLCLQLQQLPGINAISISACKLEIFPDCQVSLNLKWTKTN